MRKHSNKLIAAVAGTAAAVALSGVAYAYWTTTGAGSVDATAATANGTITLTGTIPAGIVPGTSKTVTVKAANPGTTDLRVGTVHLDSVSITKLSGNTDPCVASDFTMPDFAADQTVPHGTALASPVTLTVTGTLSFANDLTNSQDGCKGATITLTLSSN